MKIFGVCEAIIGTNPHLRICGAKEPRSLAQSKYQNVERSELFKVIDGSETYDDEQGLTPNEEGGRGIVHYFKYRKISEFGIIEIYIYLLIVRKLFI